MLAGGPWVRYAMAMSRARRRRLRGWAMWGLAISVYVTAVFHRNALAVASLLAERRFHVGPSALAGLVAVQLGIYAVMQIPSGVMADRFGPRRMLGSAALLMGAGELIFAVAHGIALALVGRGLVGLGDSLTFLSVLRVGQNWFRVERYALLAALASLVGGIGQLGSTAPLRLVLAHLGWGPAFAITALVTFAVGAAVFSALRDGPAAASPADDTPADNTPGDGVAGAGRGGMRAAVTEVTRRAGTWRGMWAHFALTGNFAVFTALWGYPFLVRAEHYGAGRASDALALVVLSSITASPLAGIVMARWPGSRVPIVYGVGAAMGACWVVALLIGTGHVPGWLVVAILVSTGLGAPASAAAFDLAREANRPRNGGAATGVVNIGGFTAAVLSDLAIGLLLATVGHGGHHGSSFEWPMASIPAVVAIGMAGFWWCGRERPPRHRIAATMAKRTTRATSM